MTAAITTAARAVIDPAPGTDPARADEVLCDLCHEAGLAWPSTWAELADYAAGRRPGPGLAQVTP